MHTGSPFHGAEFFQVPNLFTPPPTLNMYFLSLFKGKVWFTLSLIFNLKLQNRISRAILSKPDKFDALRGLKGGFVF